MSALADRHLGEAFVRLRLRLEGMLGRDLSETLDEAAFITAYAALGLPGEGEKVKGVP